LPAQKKTEDWRSLINLNVRGWKGGENLKELQK